MALFSIVVSASFRVALVYAVFALHSQSFCVHLVLCQTCVLTRKM